MSNMKINNQKIMNKRISLPPRPKRFLKLAVYPTRTADPLKISTVGLHEALAFRPEKFNVLQILGDTDPIDASYINLSERNTLRGGESMLFNPQNVRINRRYFDHVNNFLLLGGEATSQMSWIMCSLMYIKAHHANENVYGFVNYLKHVYPILGADKWPDISSIKIKNDNEVNIHFYIPALFPNPRDIAYEEITGDGQRGRRFLSWSDMSRRLPKIRTPQYKREIHDAVFLNLPQYYRHILSDLNIEVREFYNGFAQKRPLYTKYEPLLKFPINLFYWSSLEDLGRYMEVH